jgi:hypothetical protein
MFFNRKFVKTRKKYLRKLRKQFISVFTKRKNWLLRAFLVSGRQPKKANAGFVLPTVAMVIVVVVLLTTAILFRSFERSKNASNVRVNEIVLKAATPAIDRARTKIEQLFADPTLPRSTPSDGSLYNSFNKDIKKYTFGDETPLVVRYDIDGNKTIDTKDGKGNDLPLEKKEAISTAWRFPVDTDNNGKYDSYTLYSISFRSPTRADDGKFDRNRSPLDARTPPMDDGSLGGLCAAAKGTSASLIGESGWYRSGSTLKKSFFVYAATVPIITDQTDAKYEKYKGNKGFSALEFQQDQERVPIVNNAVVYEDDLEITPGSGLKLNGSIFTNSNLLTARTSNKPEDIVRFYQVSSTDSCYFQPQNGKIIVGGNVGNGRITGTGEKTSVPVDLFKIKPKDATSYTPGSANIDETNKSANNTAQDIAFNTKAYAQRISLLVDTYRGSDPTKWKDYSSDPTQVQTNIKARTDDNPGLDPIEVRRDELEAYFKKRTRKVPFAEVKLTDPADTTVTLQDTGTEILRPPPEWIDPTKITQLKLNLSKLPATEPNKLKEVYKEDEQKLGDRILVGNNLPALWYDSTINSKSFLGKNDEQKVASKWDDWSDPKFQDRTRVTRVDQLISLAGVGERDGYFEDKATEKPKNVLDNVGGMRVVTGAGIYVDGPKSDPNASFSWDDDNSFYSTLLNQTQLLKWDNNFVDPDNTDGSRTWVSKLKFQGNDPIIIFPDTMPMTGGVGQIGKGSLLMRATAVYHYADNSGNAQTPIACVSSYYDPTSVMTAQNAKDLPVSANPEVLNGIPPGKSNNGVVYDSPYTSDTARKSAITTYSKQLKQQARLVFPDGRFVNEPLRHALENNKTFSMADNSAIDTAICAIKILDSSLSKNSTKVPDGAIYETTFLDARQVKSIQTETNVASIFDITPPDYTRSIEERQPLEVRVTVLDIEKLRTTKILGTSPQEYLLPNSGIIYATRDDALLDLSDKPSNNIDTRKLVSPTDYKVDPTRRPNGIMLINGSRLDREPQYRDEEKGIILASNLPVYIKGDFNLHSEEGDKKKPLQEFEKALAPDWSNFYDRDGSATTPDKPSDNFACRNKDPRLPSTSCTKGDSWRPATVIADAVTILSKNYRFGFRNEGDYDLRNNEGDIRSDIYKKQGFFDNNYLTSSAWFDAGYPKNNYPVQPIDPTVTQGSSSYVNNFVTPIQRRMKFNEYLMEICTKLPVSACTATDWSVDGSGMSATSQIGEEYKITIHKAGTTVDLAFDSKPADQDPELRRYPRRVAFARDTTKGINERNLILDDKQQPIPLGIDDSSKIQAFPRNNVKVYKIIGLPRFEDKDKKPLLALWYRTTSKINALPTNASGDTSYGYDNHLFYLNALTGKDPNEQPLLVPVLQIHVPEFGLDAGKDQKDLPKDENKGIAQSKNWIPKAIETTTNLAIAAGDSPGRPSESNGGLENFVRYLELWRGINSKISGSLIQYRRSAYATAPWQTVQVDASKIPKGKSIFGPDYPQSYRNDVTEISTGNGMSPFYTPPTRQWGFDVALLSQLPDLFAQQFTIPPVRKPNEFFREVGRDDDWVKTLLCAKRADAPTQNAIDNDQRPTDFCKLKTDYT